MNQENERNIIAEIPGVQTVKQTQISLALRPQTPVSRVLSVKVIQRNSVEKLNAEVRYSGTAFAQALYLDDGGALRSCVGSVDFSDRAEIVGLTPLGHLCCDFSLSNADGRLNGAEIAVKAVLTARFTYFEEIALSTVTAKSNVAVKERNTDISVTVCDIYRHILVEEDLPFKGKCSSLLMKEATVDLLSVTPGVDCITVEGNINLNILYYDDVKECLVNTTEVVSFKQDAEAIGCSFTDKSHVFAEVSKCNVIPSEPSEGEQAYLRAEFEVCLSGYIVREKEESYTVDAFMPGYRCRVENKPFDFARFARSFRVMHKAEGVFDLKEGEKEIYRIACCSCSGSKILSVTNGDEGCIAEGVAEVNVIYDDTSGGCSSYKAEIPYAVRLADVDGSSRVTVHAAVLDCYARSRGAKSAEVSVTVVLYCDEYCNDSVTVVSSVTEIAPIEQKGNLSVFLGLKGETVWDACKALSCEPGVLLLQNPTLSDVFEQDERIILFHSNQEIG